MACIFFSVVVVFVVLGASFSLPISRDLETVKLSKSLRESDVTVQLSKSLSESDVTERIPAIYIETVCSLDGEIIPVPSFSTETVVKAFTVSFEADHVKRIKRNTIKHGQALCPSDKIEYHGHCLMPEEYADQAGDEYNEEIDDEKI